MYFSLPKNLWMCWTDKAKKPPQTQIQLNAFREKNFFFVILAIILSSRWRWFLYFLTLPFKVNSKVIFVSDFVPTLKSDHYKIYFRNYLHCKRGLCKTLFKHYAQYYAKILWCGDTIDNIIAHGESKSTRDQQVPNFLGNQTPLAYVAPRSSPHAAGVYVLRTWIERRVTSHPVSESKGFLPFSPFLGR